MNGVAQKLKLCYQNNKNEFVVKLWFLSTNRYVVLFKIPEDQLIEKNKNELERIIELEKKN